MLQQFENGGKFLKHSRALMSTKMLGVGQIYYIKVANSGVSSKSEDMTWEPLVISHGMSLYIYMCLLTKINSKAYEGNCKHEQEKLLSDVENHAVTSLNLYTNCPL